MQDINERGWSIRLSLQSRNGEERILVRAVHTLPLLLGGTITRFAEIWDNGDLAKVERHTPYDYPDPEFDILIAILCDWFREDPSWKDGINAQIVSAGFRIEASQEENASPLKKRVRAALAARNN